MIGAGAGVWWWLGEGASPITVDTIGDDVQTVARGALPAFTANPETARLYAWATENKDTLTWFPCTCGCASLGHTSNRSCYIKEETARRVTYTSHAAT